MTEPKTHLRINQALCGVPKLIDLNHAKVVLTTTETMAADLEGLVHGGFVFGALDYAAMLAINEPYVVLSATEMQFVHPVRVGDVVEAEAHAHEEFGRRREVRVVAKVGTTEVARGVMTCAVLRHHVLHRVAERASIAEVQSTNASDADHAEGT